MTNLSHFIPHDAVDLDPSVRAAKEKQLKNVINATKRNPEQKMQHEKTGTTQLTEAELADRAIIWAAREHRGAVVAGLRTLEQIAMSDVTKYHKFITDAAATIKPL